VMTLDSDVVMQIPHFSLCPPSPSTLGDGRTPQNSRSAGWMTPRNTSTGVAGGSAPG
jgi:hypothetical protein